MFLKLVLNIMIKGDSGEETLSIYFDFGETCSLHFQLI